MASSIDSLSENLKSSCKNITELRNTSKNISDHFTDDDEFLLIFIHMIILIHMINYMLINYRVNQILIVYYLV